MTFVLSKAQRAIADEIRTEMMKLGWTSVQSFGVQSAAMGETSEGIDWRTGKVDINQKGDHDHSFGLWQIQDVHGVLKGCGVDVRHASVADQCRALDWMLRHGASLDRKAGAELMTATTPEAAALAMIAFERPGDRQQAVEKRVPYALGFAAIYGDAEA